MRFCSANLYRIRLRTAMLGITGICVALAVVAWQYRVRQVELAAIAKLESRGAIVLSDEVPVHRRQFERLLIDSDPRMVICTDDTLWDHGYVSAEDQSKSVESIGRDIKKLETLEECTLYGTPSTDHDIAGLTNLLDIDVARTNVTSAGIAEIVRSNSRLRKLSIAQCQFDRKAVDSVCMLRELKQLDIRGTDVDEDGLARILNSVPLVELSIGSKLCNDQCLHVLRASQTLQTVTVEGGNYSLQAIRECLAHKAVAWKITIHFVVACEDGTLVLRFADQSCYLGDCHGTSDQYRLRLPISGTHSIGGASARVGGQDVEFEYDPQEMRLKVNGVTKWTRSETLANPRGVIRGLESLEPQVEERDRQLEELTNPEAHKESAPSR